MQREGRGVEIALGNDSGRVDKMLVVRAARDFIAIEVSRGPQWAQVDVDDGVRLGQKASGFGRGSLSQHDRDDKRGHQREHQKQRVPRPFTHRNDFTLLSAPQGIARGADNVKSWRNPRSSMARETMQTLRRSRAHSSWQESAARAGQQFPPKTTAESNEKECPCNPEQETRLDSRPPRRRRPG